MIESFLLIIPNDLDKHFTDLYSFPQISKSLNPNQISPVVTR